MLRLECRGQQRPPECLPGACLTPLQAFFLRFLAVPESLTRVTPQVAEVFRILGRDFPGSAIYSSTFDQYVEALLDYLSAFDDWPIVTQEIGDTWVYGAAPAML